PDPSAGAGLDHPRGVTDQRDAIPDGFLDRRGRRDAAGHHVERLRAAHPRILGDPTVEVPLDVDPALEAVERDADPDVRGHVVLREHPDVSGRRYRAEPEFAIVREVVARSDVREAVLERSRAVSGLQEGFETHTAAALAR